MWRIPGFCIKQGVGSVVLPESPGSKNGMLTEHLPINYPLGLAPCGKLLMLCSWGCTDHERGQTPHDATPLGRLRCSPRARRRCLHRHTRHVLDLGQAAGSLVERYYDRNDLVPTHGLATVTVAHIHHPQIATHPNTHLLHGRQLRRDRSAAARRHP